MDIVWKFIEKRSAATELRDQLHVIWYVYFSPLLVIACSIMNLLKGIVYPWTALVLFYQQNLSSSIKEQGKASSIIFYFDVYHCL